MNYEMNIFEQTLPKKDQLLIWIKRNKYVYTHDVQNWGSHNYHSRAERDARELAEEHGIRRMTEKEKVFYGFKHKDAVWMWEE